MCYKSLWVLFLILFSAISFIDSRPSKIHKKDNELTEKYWFNAAQNQLLEQITKFPVLGEAKNVIFFLGDGMSIPTITASRIYKGQQNQQRGEDTKLFFETFPYTGLSKTYCVDKQVADSACSATAYLCGVKANFATIGVTANVTLNSCVAAKNPKNQVDSLAVWAQEAGKATGIVTTTRVTHASPSGNYAHVANRDYESDKDVLDITGGKESCQDIASQLVFGETGSQFNVILGGGRKKFLPKTIKDEDGNLGERLDGEDLISQWYQQKKDKGTAKYVTNRLNLRKINPTRIDYLLGLFNSDHMSYNLDNEEKRKEPTLAEMTEAAIKILRKEKKGYYLFVEGGRIDHGHHATLARKALDETVEFDKAIKLATEMTSDEDTLIVVTSDHAHTMSLAGYSNRGLNVLGLNSEISTIDKLPYTSLSYANGPGYVPTSKNGSREDLNGRDFSDKNMMYPSLFPLEFETHGGDDVGVFARGPWSHLFTGVYEQNVIPHIVAFASCIGNGRTVCGDELNSDEFNDSEFR